MDLIGTLRHNAGKDGPGTTHYHVKSMVTSEHYKLKAAAHDATISPDPALEYGHDKHTVLPRLHHGPGEIEETTVDTLLTEYHKNPLLTHKHNYAPT